MKLNILIVSSLILASAFAVADVSEDERMYDVASSFKDLTQKVDGYVKFGTDQPVNEKTLLKDSGANHIIARDFKGFDVKLDVQGQNVVLLLCDADVALIEDAGCNAQVDRHLWKKPVKNSCQITLRSTDVCK